MSTRTSFTCNFSEAFFCWRLAFIRSAAIRYSPVSTNKGSYFHNFITAFAVTLSNPLIIFLFVGLFARFAFVSEGVLVFEAVTGYLAIALGALAWWFGITFFVNKVRTQFNLRGIWILNRIIGSIVIVVSVLGLVFTLMGESLY